MRAITNRPGLFFAAAISLFAMQIGAQSPHVRTIQKNGPTSNRFDFVILADGYTAKQETLFDSDAAAAVKVLFAVEPYKSYQSYYNVHTVFRASLESGASHPDAKPPIIRKTAYGSAYNYGKKKDALFVTDIRLAARDSSLAPDVEGKIIVLVNDSRFGHANGPSFNVVNRGSLNYIAYHLGFSQGLLGDEFEGTGTNTYTGPEPGSVNITKSSFPSKWVHWIGTGGVNAFQGAMGFKKGLYRPTLDSMMRTPGKPHSVVGIEQLIKKTYIVVDAIENPSPASKVVNIYRPNKQVFTFLNLVPGASKLQWFLDNTLLPVSGGTFTLDPKLYQDGKYVVSVFVQDTTSAVRSDPDKLLLSVRQWNIEIGNPPRPDLVAGTPKVTPGTGTVNSGSVIKIDTTISNPTPSTAGRFDVEFFLSKDFTIGTDDIFLGQATVNGLDKNASTPISLSAQIPYYADKGGYYIGIWVDRVNQVLEYNTSNNISKVAYSILGPKGCITKLEYADALQASTGRDTLSIKTGGNANLRLTAPCRTGHWYVVLWTVSGTQPGLKLNNNFVVPINYDAATFFGLLNINHSPFHRFLGRIDAQGHGYPYVHLAPGLNMQPINVSHFAALFIEPKVNGNFTGVTNPVLQIIGK